MSLLDALQRICEVTGACNEFQFSDGHAKVVCLSVEQSVSVSQLIGDACSVAVVSWFSLPYAEKCIMLDFFNKCLASIDHPLVGAEILRFVTMKSWLRLNKNFLTKYLLPNSHEKIQKKFFSLKKKLEDTKREDDIECLFLRVFLENLMGENCLSELSLSSECLIEKLLQFFISLISNVFTRRFVMPHFQDLYLFPRLSLQLRSSPGFSYKISQLLHILEFYEKFPIEDFSATILSKQEKFEISESLQEKFRNSCWKFFKISENLPEKNELEQLALAPVLDWASEKKMSENLNIDTLCRICEEVFGSPVAHGIFLSDSSKKAFLERILSHRLTPWYEHESINFSEILGSRKFLCLMDFLWQSKMLAEIKTKRLLDNPMASEIFVPTSFDLQSIRNLNVDFCEVICELKISEKISEIDQLAIDDILVLSFGKNADSSQWKSFSKVLCVFDGERNLLSETNPSKRRLAVGQVRIVLLSFEIQKRMIDDQFPGNLRNFQVLERCKNFEFYSDKVLEKLKFENENFGPRFVKEFFLQGKQDSIVFSSEEGEISEKIVDLLRSSQDDKILLISDNFEKIFEKAGNFLNSDKILRKGDNCQDQLMDDYSEWNRLNSLLKKRANSLLEVKNLVKSHSTGFEALSDDVSETCQVATNFLRAKEEEFNLVNSSFISEIEELVPLELIRDDEKRYGMLFSHFCRLVSVSGSDVPRLCHEGLRRANFAHVVLDLEGAPFAEKHLLILALAVCDGLCYSSSLKSILVGH